MKNRIVIILLIVFTACNQEYKIINPNGIWTESEISELNLIVSKFDKILTDEYKVESEKKAYLEFSNQVIDEIGIRNLKGFESLSNELTDLEVFNKIWIKYSDIDIYPYINTGNFCLNVKSDYLKYLNEIGIKSDFINGYKKRIESAEYFDAAVIVGFAKNIEKVDLNDKNNRLIFAIHYLTLLNE